MNHLTDNLMDYGNRNLHSHRHIQQQGLDARLVCEELGSVPINLLKLCSDFTRLGLSVANATAIAGLAAFGVLTGHFSLLTSLTILGTVCLTLGWWSYRSYIKRIA